MLLMQLLLMIKVIISDHQRIRACNVLGNDEVSYKMIRYENEEKKLRILLNPIFAKEF